MKDYYKILGVDEEASEEEIRARWIELMKRHHPDLHRKPFDDEEIKEINEAYEVLRDHSKRLDYDLERTLKRSFLKKVYDRTGKRNLFFKIWIPISLFLFFIVTGWVVIKWVYHPKILQSEAPYEIEKILEKKSPIPTPGEKKASEMGVEIKVPDETPPLISPPSTPMELKPLPPFPLVTGEKKRPIPKDELIPKQVEKREASLRVEIPKEVSKGVYEEVPKGVLHEGIREASNELPKGVTHEIPKEITDETPREASLELQKEVQREHPQEDQKETIKEIPREIRKAVSLPLSLLAKEEEVKRFYVDYLDRYEQKDIQGFMNLFSQKAVQNQKEGYDEIRKIYKNFFDQSQKLHYRMEEVKIEIYQNRVEVKARYQVDQTLKRGEVEKIWKGNIHWVLAKEDGRLKIVALNYQHEKAP